MKPLPYLSLLLLTACGAEEAPSGWIPDDVEWTDEARTQFTTPGYRLPITRSGTERDAFIDRLLAVATTCPELDHRLLWADCSEAPCIAVLAKTGGTVKQWAEATCDDARLKDTTVRWHQLGTFEVTVGVEGDVNPEVALAAQQRFPERWPGELLSAEMYAQAKAKAR